MHTFASGHISKSFMISSSNSVRATGRLLVRDLEKKIFHLFFLKKIMFRCCFFSRNCWCHYLNPFCSPEAVVVVTSEFRFCDLVLTSTSVWKIGADFPSTVSSVISTAFTASEDSLLKAMSNLTVNRSFSMMVATPS